MRRPCLVVCSALVCLAGSLIGQSKPDKKPKPGPAATGPTKKDAANKDAAKAPKDDPVTAKDPVIVALDKISKSAAPKKDDGWRTRLAEPPKQTFAAGRDYFWHLQTNHGELTVRLRADVAPIHVTSVIYLTRAGFYDGLLFHRAIKGFMAQGGCPLGTGTGNPGYKMDSECSNLAKHDKAGILSAANEGQPRTEGSQFFITYGPTPHLDGKHTVFGEVTSGTEVLQAFEERSGTNEADKPTQKLAIERAWMTVVVKANEKENEKEKDSGKAGK